MIRVKRIGQGWVVSAVALLVASCSSHQDVWKDQGGPPRVVATIAPLASWVKAIGGNHVGVITLCTATGPHQYDFKARESIAVRDADLLVAIGLALDDTFADKLNRSAGNKKLRYVKLGELLPEKLRLKAEEEEHDHADKAPEKDKSKDEKGKTEKGKEAAHDDRGHDHHDHDHGEWDPHVWLGLDTAAVMGGVIRDQLAEIDPKNKADYDRNYETFKANLSKLETEAGKLLGDKGMKLVTFHDSMRYFARGVKGLDIIDTVENGPGNDPNARRFIKLIDECKEKGYKFIAKEPQYQAQSVETLKNALKKEKLDVTILDLDPLETAVAAEIDADWYFRKMRQNMQNLRDAQGQAGGEKSNK